MRLFSLLRRTHGNPQTLLSTYLNETQDESAAQVLDVLLTQAIHPAVQNVVHRKTGASPRSATSLNADGSEAQELHDATVERILDRLYWMREHALGRPLPPNRKPYTAIKDISGFAALCTYQVFDDLLEAKYPERRRLKARLQYLLEKSDVLVLVKDADGISQIAHHRFAHSPHRDSKRWEELQANPAFTLQEALEVVRRQAVRSGQNVREVDFTDRRELGALVRLLLSWVGRPVPMNSLIGVILTIQGIKESRETKESEMQAEDEGEGLNGLERFADPKQKSYVSIELRESLRHIWECSEKLTPRQASALLLGLSDDDSLALATILLRENIANLEAFANRVGLSWESFARIWKQMPLTDAAIGALLVPPATPGAVKVSRSDAREKIRNCVRHKEAA